MLRLFSHQTEPVAVKLQGDVVVHPASHLDEVDQSRRFEFEPLAKELRAFLQTLDAPARLPPFEANFGGPLAHMTCARVTRLKQGSGDTKSTLVSMQTLSARKGVRPRLKARNGIMVSTHRRTRLSRARRRRLRKFRNKHSTLPSALASPTLLNDSK